MTKTALVIQHDSTIHLGNLEQVLIEANYELTIVDARVTHERPILGVCFGAQTLARALGAEVYRGDKTVVGFHPVTPTPAGESSPRARLFRRAGHAAAR